MLMINLIGTKLILVNRNRLYVFNRFAQLIKIDAE